MSHKFTVEGNQPAFPATVPQGNGPENEIEHACFPGMDLRDYFAAKAMQALLSRYGESSAADYDELRPQHRVTLGENCYLVADAMIAARKQ